MRTGDVALKEMKQSVESFFENLPNDYKLSSEELYSWCKWAFREGVTFDQKRNKSQEEKTK